MKTKASYSDLKGTIDASIVDDFHGGGDYSLNRIFKDKGVNLKEFDIVGIHYFNGLKYTQGIVKITLILQNKSDMSLKKKGITTSIEEFFASFKQLVFILTNATFDHSEISYDDIAEMD